MNPATCWLSVLVYAVMASHVPQGLGEESASASPWFVRALARPSVPKVEDSEWPRNPIDAFVLARLESEGLAPAGRASRETLARRASLDLLGVPVSGDRGLGGAGQGQYESWVDDLLGMPEFGERWARHWMDLTRYSDSNGYNADEYRPHIWRYRDYLIDAFNSDKPYDRFVVEQLAGDLLPDASPETLIATGYLRLWPYESNQRDVDGQWNSILDEVVDITGEVFLALGLKCARCHDHKFDPILQEDYYRTRAVFSGILPDDSLVAVTPEQRAEDAIARREWETATESIRSRLGTLEAPALARAERDARAKFEARYRDLINAERKSLAPYDRQIRDLAYRQLELTHKDIEKFIPKESREEWERLRKEIESHAEIEAPPRPPITAVREVEPHSPLMRVPDRRLASDMAPKAISVLARLPEVRESWAEHGAHARRLGFARWVADPRNPLTARVMVNRIWARYFGRGLAPSLNDFGTQGGEPTHPELLDWLASEFIDRGWSVKELVRLIVTSATYQQRSDVSMSETVQEIDPDNRLYWRAPVRRMDGDQLRDAMLAISGEMDDRRGGPSESSPSLRRSVYLRWMRNDAPEMVATFDGPDCFNSVAHREVTTSAPQALLLLNGSFASRRAAAFADRILREAGSGGRERVRWAYSQAFGQEPSSTLTDSMERFVVEAESEFLTNGEVEDSGAATRLALRDLSHALFNSNPFMAIE